MLIATFESSGDALAVMRKVEELVTKNLCSLEVATGSFVLYITFKQDGINITDLVDDLARDGAFLSFIRDPTGQEGFFTSENEGMREACFHFQGCIQKQDFLALCHSRTCELDLQLLTACCATPISEYRHDANMYLLQAQITIGLRALTQPSYVTPASCLCR